MTADAKPKPLMIMVGADKGGVGKTTIARVAIDYIAARGMRPRVFDTEHPGGGLARFSFADAEIVDLSRTAGKVKVFDAIDTSQVVLVDMRAGLLSATLRSLAEAGLLGAVHEGEVNLALLHVLGPTPESLAEVLAASEVVGGGSKHFVVKNNILAQVGGEDVFAEWATLPRYAEMFARMEPVTITVPRLPEELSREVQQRAVSFSAFAADRSVPSRSMRGFVRTWLDAVWADMDKVGLGTLASAAAPAAQA